MRGADEHLAFNLSVTGYEFSDRFN